MTRREFVALGRVERHLEEVVAGRIKKAVAHHRALGAYRDHRFRHEAVQNGEGGETVPRWARQDFEGSLHRESPDENCETPENGPLRIGQKPIAPFQRRLQRSLTRGSSPLPWPDEREVLIQKLSHVLKPIMADPSRGEFQGKRDAVESAADCGHRGGILVGDLQASACRLRPLQKELDGRKGLRPQGA